MIKLDSVLFATDFSADAEYALDYAASLAELFKAKLYMLHVIADPADALYGHLHGEYPALVAGAKKKATELMARYEAMLKDVPNREVILKEGDPTYEIGKTANEKNVGAIVVGSHGHSALGHLLLGDTSSKLVENTQQPIFVVRHPNRRKG